MHVQADQTKTVENVQKLQAYQNKLLPDDDYSLTIKAHIMPSSTTDEAAEQERTKRGGASWFRAKTGSVIIIG